MVFVRISDGLGNQFFQYATGLALARKLKTRLGLDLTGFRRGELRQYELGHFQITARPWTKLQKFCVRHALRRRLKNSFFNHLEDRYSGFQPEIFSSRGHVYLSGTWISENYFSAIAAEIRREFTFAAPPAGENKILLEKIAACPAICVHVRRGDYVSNPQTHAKHGLCDVDYYQKSFTRITRDVAGPVAFVFSDDPLWTRANLRFPGETVYVTHNVGAKNHEDFRLMRACKHFIIANSTFSWWRRGWPDIRGKSSLRPSAGFKTRIEAIIRSRTTGCDYEQCGGTRGEVFDASRRQQS